MPGSAFEVFALLLLVMLEDRYCLHIFGLLMFNEYCVCKTMFYNIMPDKGKHILDQLSSMLLYGMTPTMSGSISKLWAMTLENFVRGYGVRDQEIVRQAPLITGVAPLSILPAGGHGLGEAWSGGDVMGTHVLLLAVEEMASTFPIIDFG
ncbi:hypothetical protein ACJX0J_013320, partial [Zea mays]